MKKAIVIPLKDPAGAKTRLSSLLSTDERSRLAWAMFEDVASAVYAATLAASVFVVTSYRPAMHHARRLGWDVLEEDSQRSESQSVDWACSALAQRGVDLVLRLPADVPLVQPADIDALLAIEIQSRSALIVPSRDGTGTNALGRTPPDLFPSHFGPDSFAIHREEAGRVGATFRIVDNERLALDVDEPADVEVLLECGARSRTHSLLVEFEAGKRLANGSAV